MLLIGSGLLAAAPAATPAWASTTLLQSWPQADSTVTEGSIDKVGLSFTENIDANLSSVVVRGSDGSTYNDGHLQVLLYTNLEQQVRPLPVGEYQVTWVAATGTGDPARGEFRFTVTPSTAAATPVAAPYQPTYDGGGPGEWLCLGIVALIPLTLFMVMLRRRHRREMDLPPARPDRGTEW
ncbi:copper resistance protein CopC [Actinoplanes sp. KI2]|uniref:copper resistance CopC family protein n=1 Tax=Actinoplanes sp. KI2 TaxID=2983315 RepID=UPI0021D5C324|nr:copper resistance protein CopC [Actinoplanes sp. KI2]MCU7727051.1 copper resistance protein CopC [Actinoplanes sp. KI2]